ncbi:MAG: amino acid ABC transporter permease [Alphaproteobacteria bacterium]|nr:amino acid ABC transporter permease [Alphaproteobacteria bacterium]
MAIETTRRDVGLMPTAPAFWNNPTVRSVVAQIVLVGAVIAVGAYLVHNTLTNLDRQGIATGFGFLHREAAFEIGETPIAYSPADTYGRALLVGLLNTLIVASLGIVLATIWGTLLGIARLSTNWLIRKFASVYVETLRNIPLLLQLFVWWDIIRISAPGPREAWNPLPDVYISNRGLIFPVPAYTSVHLWMLGAFIVGIVATFILHGWARRRQMATGQQFPLIKAATGLIIGLPLLAFILGGMPTALDAPALKGFNFAGGKVVSPEFVALLAGLVAYTAAFIAEIVRAGILGVPWGQSEAASALGLRRGLALRLVVLPQALRIIVPPMTSQYLNLTKNSSLAVAIGFPDITSIGNTTINQTGQAIEGICLIMVVYLTISIAISLFMNWYNRFVRLVER